MRKKILVFLILIILVIGFGVFALLLFKKAPKIYEYEEPGLVAYYKFDKGSGCVIFDSSGNENQGFLKPTCPDNSPSWIKQEEEKNNFALKFDGKDDYLEIPASANLDINKNITIEISLKYLKDPKTFNGVILAKCDKDFNFPYFFYSSIRDNGLKFVIRDNFGKEHSAMFPFFEMQNWQDEWYKVVGTFDGEGLRIFVNNKEGRPEKFTGTIRSSSEGLRIGGRGPNDLGFKGIIDEIKIYNTALKIQNIE